MRGPPETRPRQRPRGSYFIDMHFSFISTYFTFPYLSHYYTTGSYTSSASVCVEMLPQMHVIFQNTVISCGCAETRDSRGPWAHAHGAGTCSERGLRSPFRARHVSTPSTHIDHLFDFVPSRVVCHTAFVRAISKIAPHHTLRTRAPARPHSLSAISALSALWVPRVRLLHTTFKTPNSCPHHPRHQPLLPWWARG